MNMPSGSLHAQLWLARTPVLYTVDQIKKTDFPQFLTQKVFSNAKVYIYPIYCDNQIFRHDPRENENLDLV